MKYTLTMMVVLLMAVTASAQLTSMWERQSEGPFFTEQFSGSCPDGEGGIIAVGKQWNSDNSKYEAVYARFNAQGELLWRNVYSGGTTFSREFADVERMYPYDDYFLAVGSTNFEGDTWFLLTMISLNGTITTSASWDFANGGWLDDIKLTTSGLIVSGTTELINDQQLGIIMNVDDPLDINWWQTYGTYERNFIEDITDNGIGWVATGWGWSGADRAPWVLKVSYDGTQTWSHYFPAYDGAYPNSIIRSYGADMLIAGYSQLSGNNQYFVMRLDQDGNEVWMNEYGAADGQETGKWIGQASQGGYWVLGDGYSNQSIARDMWAIRINDDGVLQDNQIFARPGYQTMWNAMNFEDTDLVVVGYQQDTLQDDFRCWVERLTPTQDIEVFIDPVNPPVVIPYGGDSFQYKVKGVNHTNDPVQIEAWMQVEHLASDFSVTVRVFENVTLPASSYVNAQLSQWIPQEAPDGEFRMKVFLGDHPWVVQASDWFTFTKQGPVLIPTGGFGDVFDQPELWPSTGGFGENAEAVISADDGNLPGNYALGTAYPNPFNPTTTVNVSLPEAADLTVAVYNTIGQQVAQLTQGRIAAGTHAFTFDASALSSGVYFVRASVPGHLNAMQKVVLMK